MLEEVLIAASADFRVRCKRIPGLTGVWTERELSAKIAAIGVHISRGVTSHGFALNVNSDLDAFNLIVPCGISDKAVTSLERELDRKVSMEEVANSVAQHFGRVFRSDIKWLHAIKDLLGPEPQDTPLQIPESLRAMHKESKLSLA